MKKITLIVLIITFAIGVGNSVVYAVDPVGGVPAGTAGSPGGSVGGVPKQINSFYLQNPLNPQYNTVGGLVQGFLEIFSYLAVLFGVLMLIWIGLQFVLSQGNSEKMKELKKQLLWIVVGIAIVIGARIIVSVVINTLKATGTVSEGVIQNANKAIDGN